MASPDERTASFPKSDRILKRETFRQVYERGRKFQAQYFTAFVLPSDQQRPRIGITVTRQFGSAVERNRARRLVREVFRKNKWLVPERVDIVINAKRPLARAGQVELEGDFLHFLERLSEK